MGSPWKQPHGCGPLDAGDLDAWHMGLSEAPLEGCQECCEYLVWSGGNFTFLVTSQ